MTVYSLPFWVWLEGREETGYQVNLGHCEGFHPIPGHQVEAESVVGTSTVMAADTVAMKICDTSSPH